MLASRWGHDFIVRLLLESKAEIDAVHSAGVCFELFVSHLQLFVHVFFGFLKWSALVEACFNNCESVVRTLIDARADVNLASNSRVSLSFHSILSIDLSN